MQYDARIHLERAEKGVEYFSTFDAVRAFPGCSILNRIYTYEVVASLADPCLSGPRSHFGNMQDFYHRSTQ
jgi:hypothetical protein